MASRTTSPAGGVASAPTMKPRAPFSKLPNVAVAKKGKMSRKKNKAADCSSRRPKKRLAGHAKDAAATEAPASSLAASAADAHKVFGEMPEGVNKETNKHKRTIDLDDYEEEASSDDGQRSPTPNSVAYSKPKIPNGGKKDAKEKKKRKGDDELTITMEAIVNASKKANEVRKMARNQDAAAEERRVEAEESKVALEEKKLAMEERTRVLKWEKYLIFMDTSTLDEKQKEYVNLAREEVLVQKRGMGGMGGMGFGATMDDMGGMRGMSGFGATRGGIWEAWVASELP
ncbi:Alternative oxidase 1a, mitochondrial [Hordeum vulgare]|nr:Alternative oxidase 1a, mitochondrial [Hordeum vulgare]